MADSSEDQASAKCTNQQTPLGRLATLNSVATMPPGQRILPMSNTDIVIDPADGVGAYISGFDLADAANTNEVSVLREALGEYGVLFFRGQALTEKQHISLAEAFGDININRFFPMVDGQPKIAEVRKEPSQSINIGSIWHTDHSYDEVPAMGSILVSRITPKRGGDTVFSNMFLAYEHLSEGLKETLLQLNAVHSSRHVFGDKATGGKRFNNAEAATQDSVHPMVIAHPISGKKALYVNPQFTIGIKGWHDTESKPLLDMLYQHSIRPEFTHRFKWHKGSIAFWDNRATWHCALNDYPTETRLMHRITVEGEALHPAHA